MTHPDDIARGFELAKLHLEQSQGMTVLHTNSDAGEIIAEIDTHVVFAYVKVRSTLAFGSALTDAINVERLTELRRWSKKYMELNPRPGKRVRIDVIGVLFTRAGDKMSLEHIEAIYS